MAVYATGCDGIRQLLTNDVGASDALTLSEALQDYLQPKGIGKPKTFHPSILYYKIIPAFTPAAYASSCPTTYKVNDISRALHCF